MIDLSEFLPAIKARVKTKLKDLGAFVDEELPDYIMVMVANKKKRESMNSDLQLFLGGQTEHFTEWLHNLLDSYSKSDDNKSRNSLDLPLQKNDNKERSLKRVIRPGRSSNKESRDRSRSRSPVSKKLCLQTDYSVVDKLDQCNDDCINVRTDEDEFLRENATISGYTRVQKSHGSEQRKIVNTSSLHGKASNTQETSEIQSVVKLSTHTPNSNTTVEGMRSGSILLKRAMNEAQASTKSTNIALPTLLSQRPAAIVHGQKRKSDTNMPNSSAHDFHTSPIKSTRFVVTMNDDDFQKNLTATSVSNVKSRLGPRIQTSLTSNSNVNQLSNYDGVDARDLLLAKRSMAELNTKTEIQKSQKRHVTDQIKKLLPVVVHLNDTDEEDELFPNESSEKKSDKNSTQKPSVKRENIPNTLQRCKYWPSCRNPTTCQFIHPKEVCKSFPNCRYGEGCLYMHPPCRFASSCSRAGCPFSHAGQNVNQVAQSNGLITCRFFPNCKNANCPFNHPVNTTLPTVKVCRFAANCKNPSCQFNHPNVLSSKTSIPDPTKLKWIAKKTSELNTQPENSVVERSSETKSGQSMETLTA